LLNKREFLLPLEIADYLHCDRPTASVIIKNLEKKALIYRKKDEKNSKFHRIYISKVGQEYIQMIDSSVPKLTVSPFDILSQEEKEQLLMLLDKCCSRMKDIAENHKEERKDE
jgi:DNA-binding MarR family transcriptional regulator